MKTFRQNYHLQVEPASYVIDLLDTCFDGAETFFDLGCGRGDWAGFLIDRYGLKFNCLDVDKPNEQITKNKFPNIKSPIKEDICYATTNRQNAVKKVASQCDMFLVIGSDNSSNSKRLVEVAKKAGCNKAKLIDFKRQLPLKEILECNTIGLTSGASAPEKLVQDFISEIKKHAKVTIDEHITSKEGITFKLPSSLTS